MSWEQQAGFFLNCPQKSRTDFEIRRWEKRWRAYGAMDREDLKSAGWILDVGK